MNTIGSGWVEIGSGFEKLLIPKIASRSRPLSSTFEAKISPGAYGPKTTKKTVDPHHHDPVTFLEFKQGIFENGQKQQQSETYLEQKSSILRWFSVLCSNLIKS